MSDSEEQVAEQGQAAFKPQARVKSDSEEQVARLAELLAKQLEDSAKREERLTALMERMCTPAEAPGNVPTPSPIVRGPIAKVPIPHELPSSISLREFDAWRHKLQNHATSQRWSLLPVSEQRSALLAFLSDDWSRIIRYQLAVSSEADLTAMLDAMQKYLREQRNVVLDRREFDLRRQEPGETFDDFVCALREIAGFCDFCETCVDIRLRDRIISGIRDEETLKRLLEINDISLEKTIDICRACENASRSTADLRGGSTSSLQKMSQYKRDQRERDDRSRPRAPSPWPDRRRRRSDSSPDRRGGGPAPHQPRCN